MATITRLVRQADQKRVNIYIDSKFVAGTRLEFLLANRLKVGVNLSEEQVKSLQVQGKTDDVFASVVKFATLRPRSQKEIEFWFAKKQVPQSVREQVLERLKKIGVVNDLEFAKWWIEQRNTFRPKPQKVLELELKSKGVSQTIIEEVFTGSQAQDDVAAAKQVAEKKWRILKSLPSREAKRKMIGYLSRKGYSWEVVKKVVDEMTS